MTLEQYRKIFSRYGSVMWNGTKYRATGIQCVKAHGSAEKIYSVRITSADGRINYWIDPAELTEVKK